MPFSGYPVFPISPRVCLSKETGAPLIDFPLLQGVSQLPNRHRAAQHRPARAGALRSREAALTSIASLFSACSGKGPNAEMPTPAGTRWAFLHPQRAVWRPGRARRPPLLPRRVCFTPTTLLSFRLQGVVPSRDRVPVTGSLPPVPLRA
jgi:hypothetical protein